MEETIPRMFRQIVKKCPEQIAQLSRDKESNFRPTSYKELYESIKVFASGLYALGIRRGDNVGLISDNRREWLIADLAILSIGAADVPRGCDCMPREITYILKTTGCRTSLVENEEQLKKILSIKEDLPSLKQLIVMDEVFQQSESLTEEEIGILSFETVFRKGSEQLERDPELFEREMEKGRSRDTATIIFTSGTTGKPKGVMLSHGNILHQVYGVPGIIIADPGEICLSVLPIWHSFERIMEYIIIGMACTLAYSKPTAKIMLSDFSALRPCWMAAVPRVWEAIRDGIYRKVNAGGVIKKTLFHFFVAVGNAHSTLYCMVRGHLPWFRKRSRVLDCALSILPLLLLTPLRMLGNLLAFGTIKKKLGGRFTAGFSAGGSLPASVNRFFSAVGILLLQAYGLTESAPLLTLQHQKKPVKGTVGPPIPETEIRIVDDNYNDLPAGEKGIILARGPQIMPGYYKNPQGTAKVLSPDKWLDTGDLGMLTCRGELIITGRAKDTIVLLDGENVEPAPIEEALRDSAYIEQAVVLGQDQKFLSALIVPDLERLCEYGAENRIEYSGPEDLIGSPEIHTLITHEIRTQVSPKNGFKDFEQIFRFKLLPESFQVGKELSLKREVMRHAVNELYRKEIEELLQ